MKQSQTGKRGSINKLRRATILFFPLVTRASLRLMISHHAALSKTGDASVPIYLNEQHAAQFVDMPSAIAAVRAAFVAQARGEAVNIPRTRLEFGERRLNLMAGGGRAPDRYALKSYGSAAYHILLYSARAGSAGHHGGEPARPNSHRRRERGRHAGDGAARGRKNRPHRRRPAGAHADSRHCGASAASTEVAVFARDRAKQTAFCERLQSELALPVRAAGSAQEAVEGRRHRGHRHQFVHPGGDERMAFARHACERHGGQCGLAPRARCADRAAGRRGRHRRYRAGQDRGGRVHRSRARWSARLERSHSVAPDRRSRRAFAATTRRSRCSNRSASASRIWRSPLCCTTGRSRAAGSSRFERERMAGCV